MGTQLADLRLPALDGPAARKLVRRDPEAAWPDMVDYAAMRQRRYHLGTAHLDHDPANCRPRNLRALCQRCHLGHDRLEHRRRRRLGWLRRRAMGDLFQGPYGAW